MQHGFFPYSLIMYDRKHFGNRPGTLEQTMKRGKNRQMEMETSMMPLKAQRLTVDEDALASQVLEIIGGFTLEALQTLEEPGETDVWPMEEGDDSVFYSDDDQAREDNKANTSCGFGANERKLLVNSVAAEEDESFTDEDTAEMEKDVTQQVILTEQEEESQDAKTEDQSRPADPGAESNPTQKPVSTCGESLNCTIAGMQTQEITSAEKVNLLVEKEEVTRNREPFDVTNKESYTRLNGKADGPEQVSGVELQISDNRELLVEPEQDHNFLTPVGFHQNPSPGSSTMPLPKKSCGRVGSQESFNHLSSSKYSTVSYRRIRRGNTRQKIEKFEFMVMNL